MAAGSFLIPGEGGRYAPGQIPQGEAPDAGRVLVNGKAAKASYTVKEGDVIEITFGNRPVKVRVLAVAEPKGKDVARELFEVIEAES